MLALNTFICKFYDGGAVGQTGGYKKRAAGTAQEGV